MTALAPNSQATGVEAYEDMFKEITRKLYGEETGHGLHTLGTPIATHVSTNNSTVPEGERSFTTLLSDRGTSSLEYDQNAMTDSNNLFKNDDHLAAFGLAALMQNGFTPHSAILNTHTFQQMNKQQQQPSQPNVNSMHSANANNLHLPTNMNAMQQTQSVRNDMEKSWTPQPHTDELNSWNSKGQNYPKIKKQEPPDNSLASISPMTNNSLKLPNNNGNSSSSNSSSNVSFSKRYSCTSCPYSTDRRDLFTRHENIHKEDKPFHCYVESCMKQFNRADHVKKHFFRMHRALNYDIARTRRLLPQRQTQKKPTATTAPYLNQSQTNHPATTLNIPSAFQTTTQNNQHNHQQQSSIIDQTSGNLGTAINHQNLSTATPAQQRLNIKVEKNAEKTPTKKGKTDRRFLCCYCNWSGSDNWGLKRHLNTHTKPFVCVLCDYKAARSERLVTHVFKVHNKKVCIKCNYLADSQTDYDTHVYESHSQETRTHRGNHASNPTENSQSNNGLRNANNSFNTPLNSMHGGSGNLGWRPTGSTLANNANNTSTHHITSKSSSNSSSNQKRGAERLFQYFEADDSDPEEDYSRLLALAAISRNTASVAQDFHKMGGKIAPSTKELSANVKPFMQHLVNKNQRIEASNHQLSAGNKTDKRIHNVDNRPNEMQTKVLPPTSKIQINTTSTRHRSIKHTRPGKENVHQFNEAQSID